MLNSYDKIITECRELAHQNNNAVIAIDGRTASGKSTLADIIAKEIKGTVIHADDFFLPYDLRTKERLAEPGGNIHYERFYEEVISKLSPRDSFTYGVFNCSEGKITTHNTVDPGRPIIIEGAYSASPRFGKYYDMLIFVTASLESRLERIVRRNGVDKAKMFKDRWIPLEEAYFASYSIEDLADIIIDTTDV